MKLLIVGGVAGGASAAARARRLSEDAEIILFERGPDVSFANCGLPYYVGGKIADRFDRRKVAIFGAYNAAFFLFLYPHIHNPWILVAIGPCEAVGAALTAPAMSSLLTQGAHDRELGRRQGLSTTFNTAALATSASLAGPLFAVKPSLPFTVFASASAVFTTSLFFFWRHAPGRIRESREV